MENRDQRSSRLIESGTDTPIPAAPAAVSAGAGAATKPVKNAAVDTVTVTEMVNLFTIVADNTDNNARPVQLDDDDDAGGNVYRCKGCRTRLARADDVISKSFYYGGRAYLFDKVQVIDLLAPALALLRVNVTIGEKGNCFMMTGLHSVADILCVGCGAIVGLKYEAAYERSQKYTEGKFMLQRHQLLGPKMKQPGCKVLTAAGALEK